MSTTTPRAPVNEAGISRPRNRLLDLLLLGVSASVAYAAVSLHGRMDSLKKAFDEESGNIRREVVDRTGDIARVLAVGAPPAGSSATVDTRRAAAGLRALDLSDEARQRNSAEESLLYLINGVNHDPSNMKLIAALASAADESKNAEMTGRAIGILELATVQVAPDDVPQVLQLIASLRAPMTPKQPPADVVSADESLRIATDIVAKCRLDEMWRRPELIQKTLADIQDSQQRLDVVRADTNDARFAKATATLSSLSEALLRLQVAVAQRSHVSQCIDQLKRELDREMPSTRTFASIYASAQSVLAQLWGGSGSLPTSFMTSLEELAASAEEVERALQKKLSAAPLAEIRQITASAKEAEATAAEKRRQHEEQLKARVESLTGKPITQWSLPGGILTVGAIGPVSPDAAMFTAIAVHMLVTEKLKQSVRVQVAEAVAESFKERVKITPVIRFYADSVESISAKLEKVLTPEDRQEAVSLLRGIRDAVAQLEVDRRVTYNQWALSCVNGFMADWNNHNLVSNEEAQRLFARYHVAEIDETLIIPEVARVLGRVMTCMTGELPVTQGSEIEHVMAASKKMSLEDF